MDRVKQILAGMGYSAPNSIAPFQNGEDGEDYQVWLAEYSEGSYVLKQAKGRELELYRTYFSQEISYAPQLHSIARINGIDYLLMEYIPGHDLRRCNREDLILVLNALIAMQKAYWQAQDPLESYAQSLKVRKQRRNYLLDNQLERAYDAYLAEFSTIPRTLCHDDLLPFNVIVNSQRAVLIDWEVGGILPYPTSLARLIAHGEEEEKAFFYMREADKAFAVDYYFQHFVQDMGIRYEDYCHSLQLCLFYEYCEWVYVGHKNGDTDSQRFRSYLEKAKHQASILGFER